MNLHVIPQYPGLISIIAFVVKHNDLFPYLVPQLVFKSFEGCASTSQLCASTTQHKGQHREGIQYSPGGEQTHEQTRFLHQLFEDCYYAEHVTILSHSPDPYF